MAWQDAIQDASDGCRLLLEVSPAARRPAFPAGFNEWRGRIGIAVRAAAQDGKANKDVVALVADVLGVPKADVSITAGASDPRKTVAVSGLSAADVRASLGRILAESKH